MSSHRIGPLGHMPHESILFECSNAPPSDNLSPRLLSSTWRVLLKKSSFMRWFIGAVTISLVGFCVYVGSALISLGGLAATARSGNGVEVLARTDVPRLRRSLVDQIVVAYLRHLGRDRPVKPLERIAANTYGASIADATIAKLLTPGTIAGLLNGSAVGLGTGQFLNMEGLRIIDTLTAVGTLQRISFVKPVEMQVRLGEGERNGAISIHFEGDAWKLSGIQLPDAAIEALAQDLAKNRRSG